MKQINIRNVAKAAETSIASVSRCLNDKAGVSAPVRKRIIAAAQKLYEGLNKSRVSATFEETAKVMRLVVEEALAEPTMEQLKAAGLDLTEEQADQIYLYAIKGAKVLEAFRSQSANRQPDPSGDDVQAAPQQPDGD